MTKGPEFKQILLFTVPMLIGAVFQQMYNMVDSIVVGRYVGPNALAAVGTSFPVIFFLISMVMGLTVGSGVVISQYYGAKQLDKLRLAVSTSMVFQIGAGLLVSVTGIILARPLLTLLNTPAEIIESAVAYMHIYMGGMIFSFIYNSLAGFLRALGDSRTPLYFLIISTVSNIILNIYFVAGLGWGVQGVAWATVMSVALAATLLAIYIYRSVPLLAIGPGEWIFDTGIFRQVLRIGIPSAVQQSVASMGFMAVQSLINSFGGATMAANTAAARLDSFALMPIMNLGMALSTFAGQNIGAGQIERVKRGLRATWLMTAAIAVSMSLLVFTFGPQLLQMFVRAEEVEVISRGMEYLKIVSVFYLLFGTMSIFNSVLRGAGDNMVPMYTIIVDLGVRVAVAYWLTSIPAVSYRGVWWAIPAGWGVASLIPSIRFFSGAWKDKAVVRVAPVTADTDL
ncbi:MAG TPA: MATE family efflux transporter [Bacillota bacterium]|nr:MATE family efflux transporter [Bacillota bacterium]